MVPAILSRDFASCVNLLDWLITKSLVLVWRSVFDPTVFQDQFNGYNLAGFENCPIQVPYQYPSALINSIEDLFRPLQYKEVCELQRVPGGVDLSFVHPDRVKTSSDRSRYRLIDVQNYRSAFQVSKRRLVMHQNTQVPLELQNDKRLPPILFNNGFRLKEGSKSHPKATHYIHQLG